MDINVLIDDNSSVLSKNTSRNSVYVGDYNIIHPLKTKLQIDTITRPLAATILGLNNTSIPLSADANTKNYWSDHDALESYLKTKPTCYLTLGSHGSGNTSLAKAFSKQNNCIHLDPKRIILDEIEQKEATGRCIEFNLRHNKVCKFNIIFAMLKQKLQSLAVKHRGYVISGLPIIDANTNINYVNHRFFGVEAYSIAEGIAQDLLNFQMKRKKPKSQSHASLDSGMEELEELEDEGELENEEHEEDAEVAPIQLSKFILNYCDNTVISDDVIYDSKKSVILHQIKELFKLNPDIILNVTFPYTDLALRRNHKYFNYMANLKEIEYLEYRTLNIDSEIRWPPTYTMNDFNRPIDSRSYNPKHNCKYPLNFDELVFVQNCNYRTHLNNYVEEKIKDFHPSKIINLDGRRHLSENINNIQERLSYMMNINPVIIPEPLYLNDLPENIEEFWDNIDKMNVIRSGSLTINRHSSPWYNRCPIELHHRRSIQGNTKFSVTFSKYVFLMSSLNAMSLFCKNPRPYLKLNYLEPTCRVIIIGTKSSGKSMIAKCLSWIFEAPIICYKQLYERLKIKKYRSYSERIFSEIIAVIEDKRIAKWENIETERKTQLNAWSSEMSNIFKTYISILKSQSANNNEETPNEKDSDRLNKYRSKLSFLPILDDLKSCEEALKNKTFLQFAPSNLIVETTKPSAPVIGDEDVVQEINDYILSNNLEVEVLPSIDEILSDMITSMRSIDLKSIHNNEQFGKFIIDGFPCDPEYWEQLIESQLLPDYTISIYENREVDAELMAYYEKIEKSVKSHYDRILLGTDTLIKTKLDHTIPVDTSISYIQLLLENILQTSIDKQEGKSEDIQPEKVQAFTEAINSYRENWDTLKLKLDENYKAFVEVEIDENKSDVQILDEVLLKIRKCYSKPPFNYVEENENEVDDEEESKSRDILSFNEAKYLGDTNVYCPVCYYDFGILWKGKRNFSMKYGNRFYYFNSEECSDMFQNDPTKYQKLNFPFKNTPPIRICIVGCIGSGKSTVSKKIAKELGLLYIDFDYFINIFLLPRHFKKVGWKYENSFIETSIEDDIETEYQVNEEDFDLTELFNNENEFRRIIQNYFEQGNPLPFTWIQKLIHKLWQNAPFLNTGFVIDGFPKTLTDVENMVSYSCVPDVVIEIEGASDTTIERLSPDYSYTWQNQLIEAKIKAETEFEIEHAKWFRFITGKVIANVIIDEILDVVCIDSEKITETLSTKSTISDEHLAEDVNIDPNLIKTYKELLQEYPEPIEQTNWQSFDDAFEKMTSRWERNFEINDENIKAAKEYLIEQNIKVVSVDGKKTYDNVFRNVLSKLTSIRSRCESYLEQTFVVSYDIAEILLLEGFLFLSTFHRLCPVYIFENSQTILHTYYTSKKQGRLYPVIHRPYIFFISSKENVKKFRNNPLMYTGTDALRSYQQYPIRIGVIGPPKCGKSKLTSKLADRFGLLCVSKGMAIRYILQHMKWTDLGTRLDNIIRNGKCIDTELIMKAVLIVLMDFRATTNGYIFDGFPESPCECYQLLKYGIYPIIVFHLDSTTQTVEYNLNKEIYFDIIKEKPPYSKPFIVDRYNSWLLKFKLLSDWITQDTQNLYVIDSNNSKWQCHSKAIKIIESVILKINYYLCNVNKKAVSVSVFGISNECFEKKMSCFKNFCPMCLCAEILRHSGYPADKSGLVQYKDTYYWICTEHLEQVLFDASVLDNLKNVKIPDIPAVVKNIHSSLVYEDGTCLVTYTENLPSQKIINGKPEYAASYRGKTYLFCTTECLQKFLAQPQLYYNVTVLKEFKNLPKLSLKNLPNLGYLEQSVGNIITQACCAVNVIRPKYPGIDITLSALLYIGLYLKTFNPAVDESVASMYRESLKSFELRSKLLTTIGTRFRSMKNPFAFYSQYKRNDEK